MAGNTWGGSVEYVSPGDGSVPEAAPANTNSCISLSPTSKVAPGVYSYETIPQNVHNTSFLTQDPTRVVVIPIDQLVNLINGSSTVAPSVEPENHAPVVVVTDCNGLSSNVTISGNNHELRRLEPSSPPRLPEVELLTVADDPKPSTKRHRGSNSPCSTATGSSSEPRSQYQKLSDLEHEETSNESDISCAQEDLAQIDEESVPLAEDLETCLSNVYPSRAENIELKIVRQPEGNHRARYKTEGSRGCIKDRSGLACPAVQLKGYTGLSAILQAFVGTESGRIEPHQFYRASKAGGKKTTPCREELFGTIDVLEMDMTPENNWTINIDCMGIMKIRNTDIKLLEMASAKVKRSRRSRKLRLVFRAVFTLPNGRIQTLQVASSAICCTPLPGCPEIQYLSHVEGAATGGTEIIILGRNFVKDESKIFIMEKSEDDDIIWEQEVHTLPEFFHTAHIVGTLPAYRNLAITEPVDVSVLIRDGKGKQSEPYKFTYVPEKRLFSIPVDERNDESTNLIQNMSRPLSNFPVSPEQNMPYGNGNVLQFSIQPQASSNGHTITITIPQNYQTPPGDYGVSQSPAIQQSGYNTPAVTFGLSPQQAQYDGSFYATPAAIPAFDSASFASDVSNSFVGDAEAKQNENIFNELLRDIFGPPNTFPEGVYDADDSAGGRVEDWQQQSS